MLQDERTLIFQLVSQIDEEKGSIKQDYSKYNSGNIGDDIPR